VTSYIKIKKKISTLTYWIIRNIDMCRITKAGVICKCS